MYDAPTAPAIASRSFSCGITWFPSKVTCATVGQRLGRPEHDEIRRPARAWTLRPGSSLHALRRQEFLDPLGITVQHRFGGGQLFPRVQRVLRLQDRVSSSERNVQVLEIDRVDLFDLRDLKGRRDTLAVRAAADTGTRRSRTPRTRPAGRGPPRIRPSRPVGRP